MVTSATCAVAMVAMLAVGVVLTVAFARSYRLAGRIAMLVTLVALGLAVSLAVQFATRGPSPDVSFARLPLFKSAVTMHIDGLALLMLLTLLVVALMGLLHAARYVVSLRTRSVGRFYAAFLLMVLSAAAVLLSGDLLVFFVAWEFMSVPAFLLIVHEDRRQENLRAGLNYLILNGIGNIGMLTALLLIYPHTASFAFMDVRQALGGMMLTSPWLANLVVGLMVLPFATKAGLFPTGDWAPGAYSAAPCPGAALLSGVVSKLGAYGALRLFLWLVPLGAAAPGWLETWGMIIATWGAFSIVLGSSAAVVSNDGKRLLAYSSISQSGYIFLGIGVAVTALAVAPAVATLALIGCATHIVVDALHKSSLFLVIGSVTYRTGTRDLNKLGGLERLMPGTTLVALAGAASLAGLPLTGAFVSKWLLIQSALWLGRSNPLFLAYVVAALVGSVLAVAYGFKLVGTIFLGPESKLVSETDEGEVPSGMRWSQAALAIGSFVIGLAPALLVGPFMRVLPQSLAGVAAQAFGDVSLTRIVPAAQSVPIASMAPLWLLGLLGVGVGVGWLWSRSGGAKVRATEPWACGAAITPDELRPRGAGYFWALSEYLERIYAEIGVPTFAAPEQRWQTLESDRWAFDRVSEYCWAIARRFAALQSGLTQRYVLWQLLGAAIITAIVLYMSR